MASIPKGYLHDYKKSGLKFYPYTSVDAVLGENNVSLDLQLEQIDLNFLEVKKLITAETLRAKEAEASVGSPLVSITYSELVTLSNNNLLKPGVSYRITDYQCTTTLTNTLSAGHLFDIIVTADSTSTLNENARAILHDGDTYFVDCDLSAWELKYTIDNDTSRFSWADSANGKGVVYYLKDEFNNECPYDFKNIQFKRGYNKSTELWSITSGTLTLWCYTFSSSASSTTTKVSDLSIDSSHSILDNSINTYTALNNNCFFGANCYSNKFGNNCHSNTLGNNCRDNTFGNNCYENSLKGNCYANIFGNNFSVNSLKGNCYANIFGNNCYSNKIGYNSYDNIFGNFFYANTLGEYCFYNMFGNYCFSNILGNYCYSNTFGNNCYNLESLKSYSRRITIHEGTCYVNLTSNETTSSAIFIQNIEVLPSMSNETITIPADELNSTTKIIYA